MNISSRVFVTVLAVLLWSLQGCKTEDEKPDTGPVPSIAFVSISPSEVEEYSQKVILRISYRDYDGDLGENNPDAKNLFVTDKRNNVAYQYRIPRLAPEGSTIPIIGELPIEINKIALIDEKNTSEQVTFDVYLTDRAGNKSNVVSTTPITVKKR
ncbi:MAG: hypothetical protein EAZ57_08665 [Cytophagales bacterium]|nr:MAG: hypothetical protein EAZ67_09475 [Cytophagales bacterium]TAF60098.1 MAG: hypothetical protein EAZ57_08665 [Cytophagales bacterium]